MIASHPDSKNDGGDGVAYGFRFSAIDSGQSCRRAKIANGSVFHRPRGLFAVDNSDRDPHGSAIFQGAGGIRLPQPARCFGEF